MLHVANHANDEMQLLTIGCNLVSKVGVLGAPQPFKIILVRQRGLFFGRLLKPLEHGQRDTGHARRVGGAVEGEQVHTSLTVGAVWGAAEEAAAIESSQVVVS